MIKYLVLFIIIFVLSGFIASLFLFNKRLFNKVILLLMKIFEKMLLCSGKEKFDLVVDVVLYTLKSIQKIIYIPINEEKVKHNIQAIYDANKDDIKKVVSIFYRKSQKLIIDDLERELCQAGSPEATLDLKGENNDN